MRTLLKTAIFASLALAGLAHAADPTAGKDKDEEEKSQLKRRFYDFNDSLIEGAFRAPAPSPAYAPAAEMMGATPGGAQDITFAREAIARGEVPHANTFTPEGLFSEHDLPLDTGRKCTQLLCLTGAAAPAELTAQADVRTLAQLGFASNLDAGTWHREPLNLVAIVDKSGSMSGAPLDTVKASLHAIVDLLEPPDQLTVVLYGDRAHVQVPTLSAARRNDLHRAIDTIESAGSTAMEAGLRLGYEQARQTRPAFKGRTRMMLFTDERPNVGNTAAGGFMDLARAASREGIGLTTIGVGTQFGAELATAISSVRGGNLFYFADIAEMEAKFRKDLDTMVTELAHDLKLVVRPLSGHALVGLYGIPGEAVKRLPDGGLEMDVETIFVSREKGGIFFGFGPAGAGALPPVPGSIGEAEVSYLGLDGRRYTDRVAFDLWPKERPLPLGLARGRLLVDEATALKAAAAAHLERNDQETAWRLVRTVLARFRQSGVPGLEREHELLANLDRTLTHLSGHGGEPAPALTRARNPVSGLPE